MGWGSSIAAARRDTPTPTNTGGGRQPEEDRAGLAFAVLQVLYDRPQSAHIATPAATHTRNVSVTPSRHAAPPHRVRPGE